MTHICLNMIVKNEAARIERCLASVMPYISCYAITDTGSTDNTVDLITAHDIPGQVAHDTFINFEQARNSALDHARNSDLFYDYLLFIDADMELDVDDPGVFQRLSAPAYTMLQRSDWISYWNTRLLRRDVVARYVGVTHEYLSVEGPPPEKLYGAWFRDHADGANRPGKVERDIALLEDDIRPKARSLYYLGQSLKESDKPDAAALAYRTRAALGGWDEEVWHAKLSAARCETRSSERVSGLIEAFEGRPNRAEPLYDLARHYRERGMNAAAMIFAEAGLVIPKPDDILFVEDYPYEWGFAEEISIGGYYMPARKKFAHDLCEELALSREAPAHTREQAWRNLFFYTRPLAERAPSLRTHLIDFTPPDGYRPMNPSVCRLREQMYLNVRCVNYVIGRDGRYVMPDDGVIRTRNFLFGLDDDLRPDIPVELRMPSYFPERFGACLGFEDLRLYSVGENVWASGTSRQHNSEGWCEIVTMNIGKGYAVSWSALQPDGPRRAEKNWMPIIGDEPRWIYSCDPVRVVGDRGQTLFERHSPVASAEWGGSSQAIPFKITPDNVVTGRSIGERYIQTDKGYLALIHERQAYPDPMRGQRNYQRRFVWFDADMNIRRISRRFTFGDGEGEFVCGMCWHPDGKRLVISYGVLDREAWLATVDADEVRAMLREVGNPIPPPGGLADELSAITRRAFGKEVREIPLPPGAHFTGPEPIVPAYALQSDGSIISDSIERQAALDDYWSAKTPQQERAAYQRMRQLGFPPSYGEEDTDQAVEPVAAVDYVDPLPPWSPRANPSVSEAMEDLKTAYDRMDQRAGLDPWLDRNTNAVLRTEADLAHAIDAVKHNGWPAHPDRTKNWDLYVAVRHVLKHASRGEAILDAGADKISTFLPTLEHLGYDRLTGINKIFPMYPEFVGGIMYRQQDISSTGYLDCTFAFISCLSTIEHGVDVLPFLRESARLLKPGGHLFISTDYWPDRIETGISDWRIFDKDQIWHLIQVASICGLTLTTTASFDIADRVCRHAGLEYTFVNLLFRKHTQEIPR